MGIENSLYSMENDLQGLALECAIRSRVIFTCPHGKNIRKIKKNRQAVDKIMLVCVDAGVIVPSYQEFQKIIIETLNQKTVDECPDCNRGKA